jgi:hypothetical protein
VADGPTSYLVATLPGTVLLVAPQGQPSATPVRTPITLGCCNAIGGQTPYGGGNDEKAHRHPRVYANVEDLRYLPISRPESLWAIRAVTNGPQTEPGIGEPFEKEYLAVLQVRAMGHLKLHDFALPALSNLPPPTPPFSLPAHAPSPPLPHTHTHTPPAAIA